MNMLKEKNEIINFTMLCDFYEFTMANGYWMEGMKDKTVYFDMFFRNIPDGGGYAIAAGLQQVIEYIDNLHFDDEDIAYLKSKKCFSDDFLNYLRHFNFTCDIWAIPEGTPIFPAEPILTVRGPAIEAQLLETMILLNINHQSLIATKSNRIVRAANGRAIMEFGSRRAQGAYGAILGARAAYIGGCAGSACTITEQLFGVPASGTMAHSWVQMFDSEYEAFKAYATHYPESCTLLVDTYNVLKSGIPNAIRVFNEVIVPKGLRPAGIRIDSGDITYLTVRTRKMLDEAGFPDCKIVASNSLDEYIIRDALMQGAQIDAFGVGERLITSKSEPVFGGVYKLSAVENAEGKIIPKIKVSENVEKITTPHFKRLYRLFDRDNNKAIADVICLHNETIDDTKPYEIFHPSYTWKRKMITNFIAKELLVPIYQHGTCTYTCPSTTQVKEYCREQVDTLWPEVLRFENPHTYYVDLSPDLWELKQRLLAENNTSAYHG